MRRLSPLFTRGIPVRGHEQGDKLHPLGAHDWSPGGSKGIFLSNHGSACKCKSGGRLKQSFLNVVTARVGSPMCSFYPSSRGTGMHGG